MIRRVVNVRSSVVLVISSSLPQQTVTLHIDDFRLFVLAMEYISKVL